jgi:hypothetical protein
MGVAAQVSGVEMIPPCRVGLARGSVGSPQGLIMGQSPSSEYGGQIVLGGSGASIGKGRLTATPLQ